MARQTRRSAEAARAEEPIPARVSVALEEYRSLRAEIIASLSMQQTVLSFSTLALGGLALAGFREVGKSGDDALALVIFLLALPLVSYVSLLIWLGEYARTTRAGLFLSGLEQRINTWVGDDALTWEQFLRTPLRGRYPQYAWNVYAMFLFYAAVPVGALGVAARVGDFGEAWLRLVYAGETALWLLIVCGFSGRVFRGALADSNGRGRDARPHEGMQTSRRSFGLWPRPA